jgi:nucleoside-diphosphate-sugar epimerase
MMEPSLIGADGPGSEEELDEYLSRPSPKTVEVLRSLPGNLLVLGAGGKMGLDLCTMARRAFDIIGEQKRHIIAVSRFEDPDVIKRFQHARLETISANLLRDGVLEGLPEAHNVLYLIGSKFGSSDNLPRTWAVNTFLPGLVARRYARSRIVALSTGNVYPLSPVAYGGSTENDALGPIGEYAQSCLGRERLFGYYANDNQTAVCLIRLNYANALRYGVVTDIALKVRASQPVDLAMGSVNVIWQGDANNAIWGAFSLCATPAQTLNVTGPETASVRWMATKLAEMIPADPPSFSGTEADTALLSNASRCHALFGYPTVPLGQLLAWTAQWIRSEGRLLPKPTGFQARDGRF